MSERSNAFALVAALGLAVLGGAVLTGCAETATHESTGQYIDDSTITTKVKGQLAEDSVMQAFNIEVETYKGTVQLSGFVDTEKEKDRAGEIARQVKGVKSVDNALKVKGG
ncbi:MAG TPA: BON domain-containing protein [Gammaproteobacteria bacterium]|nr:BON domain-containing protein [Gammaproteobacteria bacterium]